MVSDNEIMEVMAKLWIALGGDEDGFRWSTTEIAQRIKLLMKDKENRDGEEA